MILGLFKYVSPMSDRQKIGREEGVDNARGDYIVKQTVLSFKV